MDTISNQVNTTSIIRYFTTKFAVCLIIDFVLSIDLSISYVYVCIPKCMLAKQIYFFRNVVLK